MTPGELRGRLIEVFMVAAISIVTSAVTVAWSLSATLESFRNKLDVHDKALDQDSRMIQSIVSTNAEQSTAISVSNAQFTEIQRRLDSIDRKLEEARHR